MKTITVLILLAAAVAAPAFAADDGFYIAANVGSTSSDYTGSATPAAFTLQGGYQLNRNIAFEVQYGSFGDIAPSGAGSLKISGLSIAAIGLLPFSEQWSGYGKVGMASIDTQASGLGLLGGVIPTDGTYNKSAVTYGLGGQFNFNPALALRFGLDSYSTGGTQGSVILNKGTLTVVSVGIRYQF